MTAAPPQLAPGIAAGLRRLRLAAMRQLAPGCCCAASWPPSTPSSPAAAPASSSPRNLEDFLAQLQGSAATATIEDRQQVLRLLVKDVLTGPGKITIRHCILHLRYGG
ncbi:MAG: hypothetical protein ACRDOK_26585 [Streptosporangiaceae bacterium]